MSLSVLISVKKYIYIIAFFAINIKNFIFFLDPLYILVLLVMLLVDVYTK